MLAHLCHDVPQLAEAVSGDAVGGPPGQHPFEDGAHLLDLHRLAIRDVPDPRAPVAFELDEAFLVEPDQRRADRGAASPDPLRDRRFDEPLVGMQLAADDRLAELVIGVGTGGTALHRLLSKRLSSIMSTIRHGCFSLKGEEQ